jgi:hypothetical protein
MLHSVHYLVYPSSVITIQGKQFRLGEYLKAAA